MAHQSVEVKNLNRQVATREETAILSGVFDLAVAKISKNLPALVASPASWGFDVSGDYANRDEGFHDIGNWTTSFFTGMALLGHLRTGEKELIEQVEALDERYQRKLDNHAVETMHDLGFLYSLYSVALYRLTGKAEHRDTGLRAAEVLAGRFISQGDYFRAWGSVDELDTDYNGLAIVDSLMNMPLLYWASNETGDGRFKDLAIRHTDTTLNHFLRKDDSVFHAFRFDSNSGEPLGGDNYCGRSVDSHWARGSSWAMYGFALAYKHTGDVRYLDAAIALTEKYVSLVDEEGVPVWDFRLHNGETRYRDSSSAAVAICAIQCLMTLGEVSSEVSECKNRMLMALCSDDYLDRSPECRGLLKQGQVGDGLGKARSVYTSWGDYYFMQALAGEIGLTTDWW
ncbi:glycoside hydrolase family 88 protein [Haloferula sp.]|uniref:glycoside hydrolase family 88 protein n=1 Tax=Haloferula sp. TaxID=2497595 RepID=UPI00329B6B7D